MTPSTPFRIGIIGAENSHAAAIARALNVHGSPSGFAVTHLWGETEAFAASTAKAGAIPTIVADPVEMLGQIDGLMVDHRDGQFHLAAARPFVEAGIPVFVDKPLSTSLKEASEFLDFRRRCRVPVTTMSAMPNQSCMASVRNQLKAVGRPSVVHFDGPGDPHSPYGGIFFYGIHQVDLMVELLGANAVSVTATDADGAFKGTVCYPSGIVATISMAGGQVFSVAAEGSDGSFKAPIVMDADPYAATTALFTRMFKTKEEPFTDLRMLTPIAILEALNAAVATGRSVAVSHP